MFPGLITFFIALTTTLVLTVPVRRFALQYGIVDQPGYRKLHHTPVPLLGGVAIYFGTVLAVTLSMDGQPRAQVAGIIAGATLLLATGILDDRQLLHHQIKLFVSMPFAAATLAAVGVRFRIVSEMAPGTLGQATDLGLTLFWVVGITASFSILDHMDGLVSGVAAIASFFFALLAISGNQVFVGTLGTAVFGASLGFLRWNFKPAKIFMGDGGAMFLGFMLATLGLKLRLHPTYPVIAWSTPLLILAVPIFDTSLVIVSRLRRGLIPFASPGKDHTAHRLANVIFGQRGAVLVLYSMGILGGILAVLLQRFPVRWSLVVVSTLLLITTLAIVLLEKLPYERQSPGKTA